ALRGGFGVPRRRGRLWVQPRVPAGHSHRERERRLGKILRARCGALPGCGGLHCIGRRRGGCRRQHLRGRIRDGREEVREAVATNQAREALAKQWPEGFLPSELPTVNCCILPSAHLGGSPHGTMVTP